MQTEFKSKLQAVRTSAEQVYQNATDIVVIQKEALKELTFYANAIPDFFSYQNEAVRIKNMYKRLKELDYTRNRVIPCINTDYGARIYTEYLDGMVDFINKYHEKLCSNNEDLSVMEKQLQTAIQGDPLFIESLFGGKNNESVNEELTVAVTNIEYLVDFLELLKHMSQTIDRICANCIAASLSGESVMNSIRLIANSTCRFSNRTISTIMDIYEDINNSLDGKEIKSPSATFRLF